MSEDTSFENKKFSRLSHVAGGLINIFAKLSKRVEYTISGYWKNNTIFLAMEQLSNGIPLSLVKQ